MTRCLIFFALSFLLATEAAGQTPAKPNIVLILADDLGSGDPHCYNAESKIPTPHIDRLAASGMRFTDAHSPSSVCTPTRYGLLTGRYCWRTSLKRGVLVGDSPALIEPGRLTLASLLKQHGYATAGVGKWHLGLGNRRPTDFAQPLRPGPLDVGFDYYFGIPASLDMPPYVFFQDESVVEAPSRQIGDSEMRRNGGHGFWRAGAIAPNFKHEDVLPKCTDQAVEFLRRQSPQKPFFLYLPLSAPHTPWLPTAEFRGRSQVDWYGDFVTQVDATLGRVLQTLDEIGIADNTLVIFTSDNGAHWLPTDIATFGHRSNANWRGQKSDMWEGGHRIPFVVRWPNKVEPGTTSDNLLCLTDMLATVAAILGSPLPDAAAEDSFNQLPNLLRQPAAALRRDAIVHHSGDGTFAIRRGPWKLCTALGSHGFSDPKQIEPEPGGPRGQLYNLADDPGEQRNQWLAQPALVGELTALLDKYKSENRSRP